MSVTKEPCELYRIAKNGEWASIALRCWDRRTNVGTPHEDTYYCGEIMINSSFGAWGNVWTACAEPFKRFLIDAEFDYVFTKFMGTKLHRFDGEKSFTDLLRSVIENRRIGYFNKDEARQLWNALDGIKDEATSSENDWVNALDEVASELSHAAGFLSEPWEMTSTSYDNQAAGFWDQLWPEFVDALQKDPVQ